MSIIHSHDSNIMVRRTAWEAHLRLDKVGFKRRAPSAKDSLPTGSAHLADLQTDDIIRKFSFEKQFRTELSTKRDWSRESIETLEKNPIIWYTDGYKTSQGTGAGVYGPRTKHSEPMGQFPSIFQAEIHTIERSTGNTGTRKLRSFPIAKQPSKR